MRIYEYLDEIRRALNAEESNGVPTPSWRIEEYLKDIYDAIKTGIYPSDEQVTGAVDAWLDDHPEATTTVEDGSITNAKLATSFVTPGTAAAYSSSAKYAVGDYVFYNGALYRCISAISTAEAWTAAHWEAAVLGDDVGDLKSAIDDIATFTEGKNKFDPAKAVGGYLSSNQGAITSHSDYGTTDYIDISGFENDVCVTGWARYSLQYDSNKDPITSTYASSAVNNPVIAKNASAAYIRITYYLSQVNSFMVEDSASRTSYEPYKLYTILNENTELTPAMEEETNEIITERLADYVSIEVGKNKFNPSAAVNGYLSSNQGVITASDTYETTDFIDISGFENSVCLSGWMRDSLQYDSNKDPITSTYMPSATNNPVITIDENAAYIRISYYASQKASIQIEDGTTQTAFEPYSMYVEAPVNALNEKTKDSVESLIGARARNPLYGKKWVPFGDSFTEYTNASFTGGTFSGKNKTYPRLIALRNGMILDQNFMKSGRTLAYPADETFTNSATCPTDAGYYQNIPADADYITIMLGINDSQHTGSGSTGDGEDATGEITLGTIDDNTTATYYGAYNVVLGWIRTNRPFAHVGIIVTNGTERQDYTEAQIAIARKWGFPLLNMNGDDKTPAMIRCYNTSIPSAIKATIKQNQAVDYDGSQTGSVNTHPNYQAHEYESNFVEEWLKTL